MNNNNNNNNEKDNNNFSNLSKKKILIPSKNLLNQISNYSTNLYNSQDFDLSSLSFDLTKPNLNDNSILKLQNPGLLAYYAKSEKTLLKQPVIKSQNQKKMLSLLNKKPLEKLKDGKVHALELIKAQAQAEKDSISFKEDPIAYFSKRKDGSGHLFIYLIKKSSPDDINYNPYDLEKIPSIPPEIDEYFTMTATGITHVQKNGDTDNMTLDQWSRESFIFTTLKKIKFFKFYLIWKQFNYWKSYIKSDSFEANKKKVLSYPLFNDNFFFQSLFKVQSYRNDLEIKIPILLSSYTISKKYDLKEYIFTNQQNWETVKTDYLSIIQNISEEVLLLYQKISDPSLVKVEDSEFKDFNRRNFNIQQLQTFEKKKAIARLEKTKNVNRKIKKITQFIRVIQYMILESLSDASIKCWKTALFQMSQEMASIFKVEINFDNEGKAFLEPISNDFVTTIQDSFDEARRVLFGLIRLIDRQELFPFFNATKIKMSILRNKGPRLVTY